MSFWRLDPDVIHLNHGSFGATPAPVLEEQRRLRDAMESNPTRWFLEDYQPALDEARSKVAGFVGAEPAGLGFVNNATEGVNSVLRSLEAYLRPGDEIVVTDHEYNACRNAVAVTAARTGARVVPAAIPFPLQSAREVTDSILGMVTDRTRLLMVDAVTSPTALVFPLAEIVTALEPEVQVLVDAAHAPGMIDFDLTALGASYVTVNCHKWMCAPKGSALLYVREDRRDRIYPAVISHGYNGGWPAEGGHLHTQFDLDGHRRSHRLAGHSGRTGRDGGAPSGRLGGSETRQPGPLPDRTGHAGRPAGHQGPRPRRNDRSDRFRTASPAPRWRAGPYSTP